MCLRSFGRMELRPLHPPLVDDAILLREWAVDDVPAIVAACRDPEIPRWTLVPTPYDDAMAREFVAQAEAAWRHGSAHFAVVARSSGDLVGSMTLWTVKPGVGEFGYWAVREARGRGYTTRALRLVSRWALDELGLARLQLGTLPGNVASERVAEKVGFRPEGTLRAYLEQRGERRDVLMWSLLPDELR